MLEFLQRDLQPKSETFGQLTIERRVLITPRSTVSISSIAVISSGTMSVPRKAIWNLALVLLAAGLAALAVGFGLKSDLTMALGGVGMLCGLILARFFAKTEMPCLSIVSTDGHKHQFTGQRRTLEEVRRILSDKINAGDESAVYRVSFEKGIIQPISVGHVDSVGAMLAGSGSPARGRSAQRARWRRGPLHAHDEPARAPPRQWPLSPAAPRTSTTRKCCRRSSTCSGSTLSGRIPRTSPSG